MKLYLKMAAQVLATVIAALIPIFNAGSGPTPQQWLNVAIIGAGACLVFTAPNIPGAAYTKVIISVVTAVLTVAASAIVGGFTTAEIMQIILAALGAVGVGMLKNTDAQGRNISYLQGVPLRGANGRFVAVKDVDGKDVR